MMKNVLLSIVTVVFSVGFAFAEAVPKLAIVPGGDPKPVELLALAEAKLFELKDVELLERTEIDKVLTEQKLSGLFDAGNAVELGRILQADLFAALETTSIVIFDAKTGLRFVDETLPEKIDQAAGDVSDAVKTAVEKRRKFTGKNLVTFGVLEIRNADFPADRDAWCKAMSGLLERALLHRGAAVLERSRLQHVNRERRLTGDGVNALLASMKLIDLEFTRGAEPKSFKITARIGNETIRETFRTEGPIDKPLETIRALADQLLDGDGRGGKIADEASRFLKESQFLLKISRFEQALEKAESASALGLESLAVREIQIRILSDFAHRALVSGDTYFGKQADAYPKIDTETMRNSLRIGNRALTLLEQGDANIGNGLAELREAWMTVAKSQRPELMEDVIQVNRRVLRHWIERIYRPVLKETVSKNSPGRFVSAISSAGALRAQTPGDLAPVYAELVEDLITLFEQSQGRDQIGNLDNFFMSTRGFDSFAEFAASCRDIQGEVKDKNVASILEKMYEKLENSLIPRFRLYAWVARHRDSAGNSLDIAACRARREYFEKLIKHIEELPKSSIPSEYTILYYELSFVTNRCYNPIDPDAARLITEGKCPANLPESSLLARIVALASKRNETAEMATRLMMTHLQNDLHSNAFDPALEYTRENLPEYVRIITEQIQVAEKVGPDTATKLKGAAEGYDIPGLQTPGVKPWKEEIVILDGSISRGFRYRRPIMRGDTLYLFCAYYVPKTATAPRYKVMRLDRVDLKTMRRTEGRHVLRYFDNYLGIPVPQSGVETACVDETNAYYGNYSQGIFVFPLDDSEPWILGTEEGLPSGFVQSIGTINGKLYAGLGEERKGSWLIRVDLKTREWEILSASNAKEGAFPFHDRSPVSRFVFLGEDVKRNRLLMFVNNGELNTKDELMGLWAIDGKTGELQMLRRARCYSGMIQFVFPGDDLLLVDFWKALLIDLEKPAEEESLRALFGSVTNVDGSISKVDMSHNRREFSTIKRVRSGFGTIYNGYYWGTMCKSSGRWIWSRTALDGTGPLEKLKVPDAVAKDPSWLPREVCAPTPDGKGLLVGDQKHLVLLRFE